MEQQQHDFARIERATDGSQVLFYKSTNDKGIPELRQLTEYDGMFAEMNISFVKGEAGWDALDAAFAKADAQQADAVRLAIAEMFRTA